MRRIVVVLVVLAAACSGGGDADGPTLTSAQPALDSDEARAAFEAGDIPTGGAVARIQIAAADIDVLAVEGTTPGSGVVHVASSALPCAPGVTVVAGGGPFENLTATPDDGVVDVTTPIGACRYDVVQVASVPEEGFDPATAGVGREAVIVLVTPGRTENVRDVVVAELAEVEATTTTVAPTTTAVPIVQTPQPSGRAAVDALLSAWRAGDRAAALLVAEPAQVDLLFAVPAAPGSDRGCTQGDANTNVACVFQLPTGELQVRATPRDGGFIVDFVFFTPA